MILHEPATLFAVTRKLALEPATGETLMGGLVTPTHADTEKTPV